MKKFIILIIILLAGSLQAEGDSCKLEIDIKKIRNDQGKITLAIYNQPHKDFPNNHKLAIVKKELVIKNKTAVLSLETKCGKYAVAVFHDENGNSQHDVNMLGIPKEGYGFSNNLDSKFGPPEYQKAEFTLEKNRKIEIDLLYLY